MHGDVVHHHPARIQRPDHLGDLAGLTRGRQREPVSAVVAGAAESVSSGSVTSKTAPPTWVFNWSGVPQAITLPWSTTAMLWAN